MVIIQEIRDDEEVDEWLDYYKSENTINGYLSALKKYVITTQKTPSELIEESINESGDIIPRRKCQNLNKYEILPQKTEPFQAI